MNVEITSIGELWIVLFLAILWHIILKLTYKKKNIMILVVSFIILLMYMGLNTNNADYGMYERMYYLSKYFEGDFFDALGEYTIGYSRNGGYAFLNLISSCYIGIDYQEFKFFSSMLLLLSMIVVSKKIIKENKLMQYLIPIYIIYPFFVDVIQVRNFFVEILLLTAIYLYSKGGRYAWLKYLLLLVIACSIHEIALLYIPFVFIEWLRKVRFGESVYKIFRTIGICLPLYSNYVSAAVLLVSLWLMNLGNNAVHFMLYTGEETVHYSYLMPYLTIVFGWVIFTYFKKKSVRNIQNNNLFLHNYILTMSRFLGYLCIIVPLFAINADAGRMARNSLLLIYIGIIGMLPYISKYRRNIGLFSIILLASLYGVFDLYGRGLDALNLVIENNAIFELFY